MEKIEMEKRLAVWLKNHALADDIAQGLRYVRAVERGEGTEEMGYTLSCNIDAALDIGQIGEKISPEDALTFMKKKIDSARRLITFWEENPKDTNAIFFTKSYNAEDWTGVEV